MLFVAHRNGVFAAFVFLASAGG